MNLFGKEYNQYRKKRGGAKLRIQKMARGGGERDTKRAEKREEGPQDNKDRQRQWSTVQSVVTQEVDGSAPSGACPHLYLSGHGQLPAAGSTTQRADASKQVSPCTGAKTCSPVTFAVCAGTTPRLLVSISRHSTVSSAPPSQPLYQIWHPAPKD